MVGLQKNNNFLFRDYKSRKNLISILVGQINRRGKKNQAIKYISLALFFIKVKTNENPLTILNAAIDNIKPLVELKKKTVAGKAYHIPVPIRQYRDLKLAVRWLLEGARKQTGRNFGECLGREILDAYKAQGTAVSKKLDFYNIVVVNRPFIFFK